MEKSTKNWLVGCGIGCGAVLVIFLILAITGVVFIKNTVSLFKDSSDIADTLTGLYGEIEDFTPGPDGSIDQTRIEMFLSVREKTATVRERLERALSILEEAKGTGEEGAVRTPGQGFRAVKTAFGLIPQIGEFLAGRNQALLKAEMGLGEYLYIYSLAYFSWLERSPGDGPGFRILQHGEGWSTRRWEEEENQEDILREMRRRINHLLLPMLRNQLARLREQAASESLSSWESRLEAEIFALERESIRIPWQDGLPERTISSLRSFRQRFLDLYSPETNIIELALD